MNKLLFFSVAPKILEALQIAETYMDKTGNFSGKVRHRCFICTVCFGILKETCSTQTALCHTKGYIIQKSEQKPSLTPGKPSEELLTYVLCFNKLVYTVGAYFCLWLIISCKWCLLTDMTSSIHSNLLSIQRALIWSLILLTRWISACWFPSFEENTELNPLCENNLTDSVQSPHAGGGWILF